MGILLQQAWIKLKGLKAGFKFVILCKQKLIWTFTLKNWAQAIYKTWCNPESQADNERVWYMDSDVKFRHCQCQTL